MATNLKEETASKKKRTLREQMLMVIGPMLLVLAGGAYYLNQILLPIYLENQVVFVEQQDALSARQLELREVENLSRIEEEIDRRTLQAIEAVPTEEEIPELIFQLGSIADELNLTTNNIAVTPSPSSNSRSGQPQSVGITLSFTGSYEDIVNYLSALEDSIRLTNISRVSISGDDTVDSVNLPLTVSLQGLAYYSP